MTDRRTDANASGSTLASSKSREGADHGNDQATSSRAAAPAQQDEQDKKERKPNYVVSKAKGIWATLDLDKPTLMTMFKAACAPTISLAFYQADAVAHYFTTLGYLVAIASILAVPIMPRAKFLQNLLFNTIAVCIGAAVALLAIWTGIQARNHTQAPGTPPTTYNSSQAAVCAIWLFFEVFLINTIRSARPQLNFTCILTSIFAVVSMTYGPSFPTMAAGISFARRLMVCFLTGFAIATGTNLFIFPVSSRLVVFKEMTGYIMSFRKILKLQMAYFRSLESVDMFRDDNPTAAAVNGAIAGLKALHGKMALDLVFAKRDFAWGHLNASDIGEISRLLRSIMLPLVGMSSMSDILQRVAEQQGYSGTLDDDPTIVDMEQRAVEEYHLLMKSLHEPFETITVAMDEALEHVLLRLKFIEPPKTKKHSTGSTDQDDVEAKAGTVKPGDKDFARYFEAKIEEFYSSRDQTIQDWCIQKGLGVQPASLRDHVDWNKALKLVSTVTRQRNQRELFVALYMEYLMWATGRAILDFVKFADSKVEDGTMTKKRLILPGRKRFMKWVMSCLSSDSTPHEDVGTIDVGHNQVYLGSSFSTRKDPEHLPAVNTWQRAGNMIRKIPRTMRSPHGAFGFRVACAMMSICIVAFLKQGHTFFLHQRLFWSGIMIAISMNRLAGQSVFNFAVRVLGTAIAMVASLVIWYIVDEHIPGILVFEFIFIFCAFWIVVKRPRFIVVGIISSVSSVLIIGYELQVRKIGVVTAISNFQAYYPIWELGPYRLATVAGGLFVAFIWTILPYPISENSELRKDLGTLTFSLAGHYAIVHETVRSRVRGDEGAYGDKNSPGRKLEKARLEIFGKEQLLIQTLRANLSFQTWQIEVGGKFPKAIYMSLINEAESILTWMNLIAFASKSFAMSNPSGTTDEWQTDFLRLISSVRTTSEQVSSRLALLSNSITNGTPLPPYLQPLEPFNLDDKLATLDKNILGINHIAQPGYAAFAVMQIASRSIIFELNKLTESVKNLVGELDFSFHFAEEVVSEASSKEDLTGKNAKND